MCLAPQQWSSGYRESVREYIDQLEQLSGLDNLNRIVNIESRHYGIDIDGSVLDVWVCYSGHGLGVAYHGEWTILIDSELVTAGQRIRVKVEEVYGQVGIAVPRRPSGERKLLPGDQLKLTIDKVGKNLLVGAYNEQIVVVPRETDVLPKRISVAISEANDRYVTGTVGTLDESVRPSVGDSLKIREQRIEGYPDIPINLPDTTLEDSVRVRLPVSTINTDSVSVSAKVYEKGGLLDEKQSITSSSQRWGEQGLVITQDDLPIVVRGGRYVPGINVQARPTSCMDGYVEAEFEQFVSAFTLQSVDEGHDLGNQRLRNEQFDEAIHAFVGMAELTNKEVAPEQWVVAIVQEIIAVSARATAQGDIQKALWFLEVRRDALKDEDSVETSLTDTAVAELLALSQILEAMDGLREAEGTGEKTAEAEARRDAKKLLDEATSKIENLPSLGGYERPHWFVPQQLKQVADDLLLVPSSVKKYLTTLETESR
jgi:hypothetical protein